MACGFDVLIAKFDIALEGSKSSALWFSRYMATGVG